MEAAPFFDEVAEGPAGGRAVWVAAADGPRIRVAFWPAAGAKGTVLLFPGRTEYIEKYGLTAAAFAERGLATLTIDWRGQGLADRLLPDRSTGHVGRFGDYQYDVAAALAVARWAGLPEPFGLVAHSMGGCIGLRALHEGLPVRAAAFSAPMWGIRLSPATIPLARLLAAGAALVGQSFRYAPGTGPVTYVNGAPTEGNVLTSDPDMFAFMRRQLIAHPDLAIGGPSIGWLGEALAEARALAALPTPAYPCYCAMGAEEAVVDTNAIRALMARWPGSKLELFPGARHEVLMERPPVRDGFCDRAAALFAA